MRSCFSSQTRDDGHVSRKPLSTRNLPMRRGLLLTMLVCTLTAPPFAAKPSQYVFTSFDAPGAVYTRGNNINNGGTIVGYFNDASGGFHGYILNAGVFTQIDVPGAVKTITEDINDSGTIVGQCDAPV